MSFALALAALAAALPSQYTIPGDDVFPEGVTLRPGTDQFFVSSTGTGTIYRGTLAKPRLKVFLEPGKNGRVVANGLRAGRDHLVVAGSVTGYIFVYDYRGRFVRRFATGSGGLINDVAIAPNGDVYATDSMRGLLFRIPAAPPQRTRDPAAPFMRLATPRDLNAAGVMVWGPVDPCSADADRPVLAHLYGVNSAVEGRTAGGGPPHQRTPCRSAARGPREPSRCRTVGSQRSSAAGPRRRAGLATGRHALRGSTGHRRRVRDPRRSSCRATGSRHER